MGHSSTDRLQAYQDKLQAEYEAFVQALQPEPPLPCRFKVGDTVVFTNAYGVRFPDCNIIGFAKDDSFYGRFIYLNTSGYWFPHRPAELTHDYGKFRYLDLS